MDTAKNRVAPLTPSLINSVACIPKRLEISLRLFAIPTEMVSLVVTDAVLIYEAESLLMLKYH